MRCEYRGYLRVCWNDLTKCMLVCRRGLGQDRARFFSHCPSKNMRLTSWHWKHRFGTGYSRRVCTVCTVNRTVELHYSRIKNSITVWRQPRVSIIRKVKNKSFRPPPIPLVRIMTSLLLYNLIYDFASPLQPTLLKTGKFKGCVTTETLIYSSTRPEASLFKPKSIKGVAFGTVKVFWGCGNGNWAADLEFSKSIFSMLFVF